MGAFWLLPAHCRKREATSTSWYQLNKVIYCLEMQIKQQGEVRQTSGERGDWKLLKPVTKYNQKRTPTELCLTCNKKIKEQIKSHCLTKASVKPKNTTKAAPTTPSVLVQQEKLRVTSCYL